MTSSTILAPNPGPLPNYSGHPQTSSERSYSGTYSSTNKNNNNTTTTTTVNTNTNNSASSANRTVGYSDYYINDRNHGIQAQIQARHHLFRHHSRHADKATNAGEDDGGSGGSSGSSSSSTLHAHRQSHNSSKLPAFRFADLKRQALALPNLLQQDPPSPLSPSPDPGHCSSQSATPGDGEHNRDSRDSHDDSRRASVSPLQIDPQDARTARPPTTLVPGPQSPSSVISQQPHLSPSRNRASTFQYSPSSTSAAAAPSAAKRPASFPDSPILKLNGNRLSLGAVSYQSSPLVSSPGESTTKEDTKRGRRELLLPKAVETTKFDDRRRSRPPVSYRPPSIAVPSSSRAVIPPIRSFRSSGSRKSLVLDMPSRRTSYDSTDEVGDPNHRDRTLRALEGWSDDGHSQTTPNASEPAMDNENTADIFMNIAREGQTRRAVDGGASADDRGVLNRVGRSAHTRPFSAAVLPSQAPPPQVSRRLSDQRENARKRRLTIDQSVEQMTRELKFRGIARDQPESNAHAADDSSRSQLTRLSYTASPISPRTLNGPSADGGGATQSRRRPSITDGSPGLTLRTSQLRTASLPFGQARSYSSSPLVSRSSEAHRADGQQPTEANHALEGTESSASTAAPSTVWDELDELKSRIYRLELTGKAPSTSGAAMSRVSDDRPPTATTNATTMSASPKRRSGGSSGPQTDASGVGISSQRDSQPILRSALHKAKGIVSPDVYSSIESAAMEALALSSMMGVSGQPGPISSGASTIGAGGSVTDRQLRRKAESICRSLTELCLALTEPPSSQPGKSQAATAAQREKELLVSPTRVVTFTGITSQRRPSAIADQQEQKINSSPRSGKVSEHRRSTIFGPTALPAPRYVAAPGTPTESGRRSSLFIARTRRGGNEEGEEASGRKSSLVVSRVRRAATEEPEDLSGRKHSLATSRARRAGTEEPEEPSGRKSSLLRTRRSAAEESEEGRRMSVPQRRRSTYDEAGDEEGRYCPPPSQSALESSGRSASPHEHAAAAAAAADESGSGASALGPSSLPRRRYAASALSARAIEGPAPAGSSGRRLLERSATERDGGSVVGKLSDERGPRQLSLSQTAMLNRSETLNRRRNSGIPFLSSPSAQAGSYR